MPGMVSGRADSGLSCGISQMRYRDRVTDYKGRIGNLIRDARKHRGLTQQQLAERLATSQSAVNRIEKGHQNLSLEMLARIGARIEEVNRLLEVLSSLGVQTRWIGNDNDLEIVPPKQLDLSRIDEDAA